MPTFDFRCTACAHTFEGKIPFGSKEYPECPVCSKASEKLMTKPLGIVFKGSGFYKTDSSSVPKTDTADTQKEAPAKAPETPKSDQKADSSKKSAPES